MKYDEMSSEVLVDLAKGGDMAAFGMIYERHRKMVFSFMYKRVRSVQVAEDLTADLFVRVLTALGRYEQRGYKVTTWLFTIAHRLVIDYRKQARLRDIPLDNVFEVLAHNDGPATKTLLTLESEALRSALAKLSEGQRLCLVYRVIWGLSIKETAVTLGRTEDAIRRLKARALKNLLKVMSDGGWSP